MRKTVVCLRPGIVRRDWAAETGSRGRAERTCGIRQLQGQKQGQIGIQIADRNTNSRAEYKYQIGIQIADLNTNSRAEYK